MHCTGFCTTLLAIDFSSRTALRSVVNQCIMVCSLRDGGTKIRSNSSAYGPICLVRWKDFY
jgi:hypothetical protein